MASLCEEDELRTQLPPPGESEEALAPAATAAKPVDVFAALCKKECQWGDLASPAAASAHRGYARRDDGTWRDLNVRSTLADLFAQPFAANLRTEDDEDYLNTEALTEPEFTALLSWLFFEGWYLPEGDIVEFGHWTVEAYPDTLKPRRWTPPSHEEVDAGPSAFQLAVAAAAARGPSRFVLAAAGGAGACDAPVAACAASGGAGGPKPPKPAKARIVIPRFCKDAEACANKDTTCNYVHGDTIAVKETVCGGPREGEHAGNAAHCSKRATCCHLHPDQVWTPTLVIHRTPPA